MKRNYKRIFQYLLVNDLCWSIAYPFVVVSKRLMASRVNFLNRITEDENTAICDNIFSEGKILHGLFKGLRFENVQATGSSIYAKLLGSYEMELTLVLQRLLVKPYTHFVNIGCDEGYYAAGIATIKPGIKVIAFDCTEAARKACRAMAALNGVQDSIAIKGCFEVAEIADIPAQSNILFIIDCEGCENEVITPGLIKQLAPADFIIELHYQQHPMILSKLQQLFSATHRITLVTALSDHERIMQYHFPEIEQLTYQQKHFILNEREGFMQWMIAEPLQ